MPTFIVRYIVQAMVSYIINNFLSELTISKEIKKFIIQSLLAAARVTPTEYDDEAIRNLAAKWEVDL